MSRGLRGRAPAVENHLQEELVEPVLLLGLQEVSWLSRNSELEGIARRRH
jgi:hypothetical protein